MDSDDEDEFRIDEVENVRANLVFQPGGKLSDIMAEVEIPSIDFDDNFDDDSDDTQFHDEPAHAFEHYHVFPSDNDLKDTNIFPNEDTSTVSSEPSQTDNTYSKENNDTSPSTDDAKDHSDQLNFKKLNEINFYAVESTLSNFGSSEKSLSMYDMVCSESNEEILSETELMTRLSDLSKDQLKACCSVAVDRSERTKEVNKSSLPYPKKEHSKSSDDNVSTKAIHSWPQLKKEGHTLSLQPSTVFLDLRPEAATEKEMAETEHTASIQRILGLKEQRSATSSEDDSDDDLNNWYQMRSKHKQNVCKEKESYGNKSVGSYHNIGTGHLNRIKVESTSEPAEKLGVAEVGEEELLGGFSGDTLDESVTNTAAHQIQREEGLSFRAAAIPLPTTKPAEQEKRNLDHTRECGSSLQEEEMLEHPELKKVDSLSEQKKELTKFSKEEKDERQQMPNVNEDDLSGLHLSSKNIHRNLNDRQKCCTERPVNSVIEDVGQPKEEQESLFDQSINSATHIQNDTDKFNKTSNNRQTELNGCDDEITKKKKHLDGTCDASKKTDHEVEGDDTITAVTEDEDCILETKVTACCQQQGSPTNDAMIDKDQMVDVIVEQDQEQLENCSVAQTEFFRKIRDSEVDCLDADTAVKDIGEVLFRRKNVVKNDALDVDCSGEGHGVNLKQRTKRNDSSSRPQRHLAELNLKIVGMKEISNSAERTKVKLGYGRKKLKPKKDRWKVNQDDSDTVQAMKGKKDNKLITTKTVNDKHGDDREETSFIKKENTTSRKDKKIVLPKEKMVEKEDEEESTTIKDRKQKSRIVEKNDETSVKTDVAAEGVCALLDERTGLNDEKHGEEFMSCKILDQVGQVKDLSTQYDSAMEKSAEEKRKNSVMTSLNKSEDKGSSDKGDNKRTERTSVKCLSIREEEHLRRNEGSGDIDRTGERRRKAISVDAKDISGEFQKSKVLTSADARSGTSTKIGLDRVNAVTRKAGVYITPKETEEMNISRRTATARVKKGKDIATTYRENAVFDKREVSTSTETYDDVPLRDITKIVDKMKIDKPKQSTKYNERTCKRGCSRNEPTQEHVSNTHKKSQLRGNMLNPDSCVSVRKVQNTDSRSSMHSRSQPKQRTSKETKELKEKLRAKIESMRPTVSANKKYPASFNTPIIYDQNVSYEPDYHSLLPVVEDQLTLLLVVTLLGCGEINLQRSKGKAPTEINYYFALVAWLLSLGGAYNSDVCAPFSIIGMQQAYQNGKLQLFVGVQPNEAVFDVNAPAPGKGSRKNKIRAFNKAISKYLSTRSLRSVYQNMGRVYLGGSYLVDENHYSSTMLSTCITVGQDPNAVQRVFESKTGFFWETLDIADTNEVFQDGSCRDFTPENTIVLVQASLYHHPSCILDLLCRIEDEGCDLAGLRLAYGDIYEANKGRSLLKDLQREALEKLVNSQDVLVIQATGSGKSLTFQSASMIFDIVKLIYAKRHRHALWLTRPAISYGGATSFETSNQHGITQSREYLCPRHTLALAVRGPSAISKIKNVIGAKLPILDEPGNVPSLRSLYCSTMSEDKLFYCPSYSNQAAVNLARWFGGRLSEKDLTNMEIVECEITTKVDSPLSDGVPVQKPPALLVSSTQIAFYLITSPLVPPSFLGHVLHVCDVRGFSLHGIRRMHLSKRQGNNLGLSQLQQAAFCPLAGNSSFSSPNESPPGSPVRGKVTFNFESALVSSRPGKAYPSTVIVLQRENGIYHAATLVKHLSESLGEWKKNNLIDLPHSEGNPWRLYFCTLQFCEANCKFLWGDVGRGPDTSILKLARSHCFSSNPELEQVCVLSAVGDKAIQYVGLLLKILYSADNPVSGYWELLAVKSFTHLSLIQAREVTPIEVGEPTWQSSVRRLMSTAVFVCVLRGINIIQRLREFLASLTKMSTAQRRIPDCLRLDWWISQTTEVAFRQIAVLFEENELFCDETNRANTKYVPPPRQKISRSFKSTESKVLHSKQRKRLQKQAEYKNTNTDDSSTSVETYQFSELPIIQSLLAGPRPITTVALIKPSCLLNTKKLGKIFKSVCQENFDIVGLRMSVLTRNEAEVLIRNDDPDVDENVNYLTSGASVLMCLQRENAVKKLLDILGPEDPIIARSLDPFLLRGSYGVDSIHNSMHGSETYCAALCEIRMLFPCGLCCDQTIDLEAEQISCRAYDETIGKHKERKLTKRSITATGVTQSLASSLVQVNCLVLTHHIAYGRYGRKRIAFVDVLERLLSTSFIPVGMKMALLSEEQTDSCLNLVGLKSEKRQQLKNELTEGPCIVIALQRDNAVTCFDTIIESAQAKCRSLGEYQKHILQGRTEEEANNLLLFFFDVLVPNCVDEICAI